MTQRKDKIRNKAKVIKELAKDPSLTERELAKKAEISNGSAHNHMKEIEKKWAESQIIDNILQMDDEIMELANQITLQKIIDSAPKDEEWNIIVKELSLNDVKVIGDLANNSTKRKAIFWKKGEWDDKNITIQIIN